MNENMPATDVLTPAVAEPDQAHGVGEDRPRRGPRINWRSNKLALLGVILLVGAITASQSSQFLTWQNWQNLLQQISIVGMLAFGMTLLMVSGGIDLSIGSSLSVSGLVVAELLVHHVAVGLAVTLAILAATAVGAINGLLAAHSRAHPFILTLGMLTLLQGVALVIATEPVSGLPDNYLEFAFNHVLGVPILAAFALGVGILCQFILKQTVYGRRLYALGGSELAARLAGVRVKTTKVVTYMFMGFLVGLAAVLLTSLLSAGQAAEGQDIELTVIAAVAVGGTPLAGGRGDVIGTALGVLLLGMITNALNLLSINANLQDVLIGLIIVVAVMAQRQQQ